MCFLIAMPFECHIFSQNLFFVMVNNNFGTVTQKEHHTKQSNLILGASYYTSKTVQEHLIFTARKRSLREGYVFTGVCDSVNRGGHAWLLQGGHVWLLLGGWACMVARGACVVAPRGACMVALGGHAWLLRGACMVARGGCGCSRGACVVAWGGMHGCSGGHAWLLGGHAWLLGGHAWLLQGGLAWFFR